MRTAHVCVALQAFAVILTADILLGYHSEEGWASFINLFTRHYGYEVEVGGQSLVGGTAHR